MGTWLSAAWAAIRGIQLGRLLKPLWKRALIQLIWTETPALTKRLRDAVAVDGLGAVDKAFDEAQRRLEQGISQLRFLPESWRAKVNQAIEDHGNEWQEKVKAAVAESGPQAIDAILLQAENALVARIEAL